MLTIGEIYLSARSVVKRNEERLECNVVQRVVLTIAQVRSPSEERVGERSEYLCNWQVPSIVHRQPMISRNGNSKALLTRRRLA